MAAMIFISLVVALLVVMLPNPNNSGTLRLRLRQSAIASRRRDVQNPFRRRGQGTVPGLVNCLNPAGTITGSYIDPNGMSHGFVREKNGTITTFDVPSAVNGTFPTGI